MCFYVINAAIVQRYVHVVPNRLRLWVRFVPISTHFYSWPAWLAKAATNVKNLPLLVGVPSIIILILWFLSGGMYFFLQLMFLIAMGIPNFSDIGISSGIQKIPPLLFQSCYLAAGIAVFSVARGVRRMWKAMSKKAMITASFRPSA